MPTYAIANARIVVGPESTIQRGVIVLRNGLIEAVGESAAVPADARVFDADGMTVYAGLIDGATHYGLPAPQRPAGAAPGPPAAAPAPRPADDVAAPHRYLRPQARGMNADFVAAARMTLPAEPDPRRNQGFTTVLETPREGHWQGASALVNLAGASASEAVVVSPVAMHKRSWCGRACARRLIRTATSGRGVCTRMRRKP